MHAEIKALCAKFDGHNWLDLASGITLPEFSTGKSPAMDGSALICPKLNTKRDALVRKWCDIVVARHIGSKR
jgi:hypothetical protein